MMQSTRDQREHFHVAVIMDGNGRWATRRGQPRVAGHRAGVEAVRRVVEAAPELGVTKLTLFAFSSDNWRRPAEEVGALMGLLQSYLRREIRRLAESGTRLTVIGRRDRLPGRLAGEIAEAERMTAQGRRFHLRVAIDYSARDAIARALAQAGAADAARPDRIGRLIAQSADDDASPPEVDLLIRSGGEKRLSDFLLWEAAYAELWFTDTMWPDFTPADLTKAIEAFRQRERRFGGLGASSAARPDASAIAAVGTRQAPGRADTLGQPAKSPLLAEVE
jgi:undecaprenyl diphosphate synthase